MGSNASRSTDPVVGRLVDGRYRVTGVIARGGMATVYRADDTRLDRVVALKVMHRSFAEDPGFVARFEREARAAAKLNHPHVVGVFDQGADDELVWLAMDYVPGHSLRDVIRAHAPLDPDRALGVVEQILSGLIAAHGAGFVHRDIKPENVLMTPDGTMKITDFGLARAMIDEDPTQATKGVLIGTVAYLAPEQVDSGHADERSDIYATGIVLFELLTGAVPFEGPTPLSVAYRHVNDHVPPPSALVTGIPADVDSLVLRATARDPRDRFPSAAAFLQTAQSVDVDEPGLRVGASPADVAEGAQSRSTGKATVLDPESSTSEPLDPSDEWHRIAAVAMPLPAASAGNPTTRPPDSLAEAARTAGSDTDTSTHVIGAIPPKAPTGNMYTDVLPNTGTTGPNSVPTSALGSAVPGGQAGSDVAPTTALQPGAMTAGPGATTIGPGATTISPGAANGRPGVDSYRGATPLTPVTRKPPTGHESDASAGEGVKSISRFGRTKLVVFLVLLVSLMAAGGWWLGMRHNATEQAGIGGVARLGAAAHPGGIFGIDEVRTERVQDANAHAADATPTLRPA